MTTQQSRKTMKVLEKTRLLYKVLIKDFCGESSRKQVKHATKEHQQHLKNLCLGYVNERKTLDGFLNGTGHIIKVVDFLC